MEEVIEVKPGGLNKYYLNSDIIKQYKDTFDKITVDSNGFYILLIMKQHILNIMVKK